MSYERMRAVLIRLPEGATELFAQSVARRIEKLVIPKATEYLEDVADKTIRVDVVELTKLGENEDGIVCELELLKPRA